MSQSLPSGPNPADKPVHRTTRRQRVVALVAVALVAVGAVWASGVLNEQPRNQAVDNAAQPAGDRFLPGNAFPLPGVSSSAYRNTGPDARYVGSEACSSCHGARSASFRRTGMGVSMAAVNPAREPPDAGYEHPKSGRRYQVVRKADGLWHRELRAGDSSDVALAEYPLKYVVGSGRHARTYLAEAEGFLVESPVTWYTSRAAWDMSPGYDQPDHFGFERGVGENCLYCHAGRAEAVGKSQYRISVAEAAIGCERCHGPGSLHAERHARLKGEAQKTDEIDYTIVNPKRLPRELVEAICYQCHLHAPAMVPIRGRRLADFRPGLPLEDFRTDYKLEAEDRPMTVTGHVEQMHLSRCYKESATLTCVTCHDPHGLPEPAQKLAHYRAACLTCHSPEKCRVDKGRLLRESPDNNCAKCHMPSAATEVAHVSFTHHRIGIHPTPSDRPFGRTGKDGGVGVLRPWRECARLSDADRQRSLGLAYLELSKVETERGQAAAYHAKAVQLMSAARATGLRDPVLEAKLARYYFQRGSGEAIGLAETALSHPDIAPAERCDAMLVLGVERLKRGRHQDALSTFRELVTLRRHPDDWLLTAECEKALGNRAAAEEAMRNALRINPRLRARP